MQVPGSTATHAPTMRAATGTGDAYAHAEPRMESQPLSVSELELPDPHSFADVVELAEDRGEMILHANLISNVHLVSFQPGKIEYHPADHAPQDLAQRLIKFLNDHTPRRWSVTVSREAGQATLNQQKEAHAAEERAEAAREPLVKAVLEAFPGAHISHVKDLRTAVSADVPSAGDGELDSDGLDSDELVADGLDVDDLNAAGLDDA